MPERDPFGRLDWLVGALLFVTYAWFYQGGYSNQNTRFDLALSLTFEHRAAIDTFAANTIDKVFVGGHYFLEKAPGTTYLALPVPFVASLFWSVHDLFAEPWRGDLLLYSSTVASVSLLTAIAGVFFRRTLMLLNPELKAPLATAIALAIFGGTLMLPYATMLFGHACAASWITIGLYGLLRAGRDETSVAWRCGGWLALGAAVLTEYPSVLLAAAVGVAAVAAATSKARRGMIRAAPLFVVPLAGILIHNAACFGSPFAFGYGKLDQTMFGAGMSRGFFGIATPSPTAFVQLLFGSYRGLFFYSPILALSAVCWAFAPSPMRRRVAAPLLASVLGLVLVISGYTYWQGGVCFGPRHLVVAIPILGLGAAFVPRAWSRSPPVILAVFVSTFLALIGTVITPFVSEQRLSPLTEAYLPLLSSGKVSITPLAFLTPASEGASRYANLGLYPFASFNLGELVGLRGWWSVAPLGVAWICAIVVMRRHFRASSGRIPSRS